MSIDVQIRGAIGSPIVHCIAKHGDTRTRCGIEATHAEPLDMNVKYHKRCRQCIDADPFWSVVLGGNHAGDGPLEMRALLIAGIALTEATQ